jgi:hypothetical protein
MFRQGDLLFVKVNNPDTNNMTENKDPILARGEATGHAHRVSEGEIRRHVSERLQYLTVTSKKAVVTHEEHGPVELTKGTWEIKRQREYEPEGWRTVAD